jgi:uncharacterized phosphosugar-binding protein
MKAGRKRGPPSAELYLRRAEELLRRIREEQAPGLAEAADLMAHAIAGEGVVYLFGSGHSILPAMDVFPRYGSFVGFSPLLDPRLMWWNVIGPGGVRELLWLERSEGYARIFLSSYRLRPQDVMLVYSHGGLNAAPVEVALEAKRLGLQVIAVTSLGNARSSSPTHSSGKRLADVADVVIDNCVPPEDALVRVDGLAEPLAAGSTLAAVAISMALVAEVGARLVDRGLRLDVFVSPNTPGVVSDHNASVFAAHRRALERSDGHGS